MKQLVAFAKISNADGSSSWEEDFKVSSKAKATEEVQTVIDNFNNTLKPGESARSLGEIVRYEEQDVPEDDDLPEDWDEDDDALWRDRDFDFDDDDDRYDFETDDENFD